jgi:hypothetical protein
MHNISSQIFWVEDREEFRVLGFQFCTVLRERSCLAEVARWCCEQGPLHNMNKCNRLKPNNERFFRCEDKIMKAVHHKVRRIMSFIFYFI